MKSVRLEWCLSNLKDARTMLDTALTNYVDTPKLYMMRGQIAEQEGDIDRARKAYLDGVRFCI
jgi:pre-mRNA-processing factor 6